MVDLNALAKYSVANVANTCLLFLFLFLLFVQVAGGKESINNMRIYIYIYI